MGVIVTVVIWPVTVMTDVMGVGVQVDLAGALDVVDGIRGVEEVLDGDSDVVDWEIGTGIKRVDAFAGVEVVVVSVLGSGVVVGV